MMTPMPHLPPPVVRSPRGYAYLVGAQLGHGEFGAVFECVGPFDQEFALKVYRAWERPYDDVRIGWKREAERLWYLRHPNIVYVHDYFEADGLFYLVLERCDHSLEDMLGVPFTHRLILHLMRQILFAIQYMQDNEVVHNDLHGGNILLNQGDELTVKLSDFGIAQELFGAVPARPSVVHHRIMSPEVALGGYSTKQGDLYQLGLLMYTMYTGELAIDPDEPLDAVVHQIQQGQPRAMAEALGTPLGDIISVLLRRHDQYRYQSPAQVWDDLRRLDVWQDAHQHDPEQTGDSQ